MATQRTQRRLFKNDIWECATDLGATTSKAVSRASLQRAIIDQAAHASDHNITNIITMMVRDGFFWSEGTSRKQLMIRLTPKGCAKFGNGHVPEINVPAERPARTAEDALGEIRAYLIDREQLRARRASLEEQVAALKEEIRRVEAEIHDDTGVTHERAAKEALAQLTRMAKILAGP